MTRDEAIARIEPIIRDLFEQYHGPVTASLAAKDVKQWDSLANVQLVVMVERAFGTKLANSEVTAVKNLGGLAELVLRKTS